MDKIEREREQSANKGQMSKLKGRPTERHKCQEKMHKRNSESKQYKITNRKVNSDSPMVWSKKWMESGWEERKRVKKSEKELKRSNTTVKMKYTKTPDKYHKKINKSTASRSVRNSGGGEKKKKSRSCKMRSI